MNFKNKSIYSLLMLSALFSTAYAASTMPILIKGLPIEYKHPTVPGEGVTQLINLTQLNFMDAPWTVTCQYQTHENGKGTLPISILGTGQYYGNYFSQMYIDDQYAGPADLLTPSQAVLTKETGVIKFTGVYTYRYVHPSNPAGILLTNIDGTGDFTITSCSASLQ